MEARIIEDRQKWNDFVASTSCCSVTQMYEWGELNPRNMNAHAIMHIGVVDDAGNLQAAMVMTVARAPLIRQVYFYVPRGPIIENPASPAMTVLLNFVKVLAHKYRAFMLKVEPAVLDDNADWSKALKQCGFQENPHHMHVRNEWMLDVRPDEKMLLSQMKEKWRYNIRLAGRKGVVVRQGTTREDLDAYYRIYQVTSERDKFHINQESHYEDVLRLFGKDEHAALLLAEYEGKPIAGIILLVAGPWCYYMYGASSNEYREKMPNYLLQWTGIQWAKAHGCHYYNFRGIPEILEEGQEMYGIYLFKRGFGGGAIHALATHDLPYRPLTYLVYRSLLDIKHRLDVYREKRLVTQTRNPAPATAQPQKQKAAPAEKAVPAEHK
jgi:lipid II:glycine glycyltransferase (peptidoglycan interpeptide bridge formation enzyme)